jgi:hypothetical protein
MKRSTQLALAAVKFAAEMALAACWLVAVAWGLAQLAEYRQNLPIRPGSDGTVTLDAARATLQGQLRLFPTDLENQTEGYGNEYGRKLVRERENRKIGNWTSVDDTALWEFRVSHPGTYEVSLELAAPDDEAGSKFSVTVGTQTLSATVPSTGGWQTWKTVPLFPVDLSAGTQILAIKPERIRNHSLMNLARVILRPAEAGEEGGTAK